MPIPTALTQGTNSTPVNPANWNEMIDGQDNLRDYYSKELVYDVTHEDFGVSGAVGDDVADDRDAINDAHTAATANGGVLYFPGGTANNTYKISSNLTFNSDVTLLFAPGANLSIDTGVTVTINSRIAPTLHKIFTLTGTGLADLGLGSCEHVVPQWWGALGDDSTDCHTAFELAIDSLVDGGGMIYVPPGVYRISEPIDNFPADAFSNANEGIIIRGAGVQTILKYMGTSGYCFELNVDDTADNTTVFYTVIEYMRIHANQLTAAAWPTSIAITGGAIELSKTAHCTIRNVVCTPVDNDYGTGVHTRAQEVTLPEPVTFVHDTDADFTYTGAGAKEKLAMKFTPSLIVAGKVKTVTVTLREASADGTVHAEVWSDSSGPSAQIGGDSETINCTDITSDAAGEEVTFTFLLRADMPNVVDSTDYWLVLATDSYTAGTLSLRVDASKAGEALVESFTFGGAWAAEADGSNNSVTMRTTYKSIWNRFESVKIYGSASTRAKIAFWMEDGGSVVLDDCYISGDAGLKADGQIQALACELAGNDGLALEMTGGLFNSVNTYFDVGNLSFDGGDNHSIDGGSVAGKITTTQATHLVTHGTRPFRLASPDPGIQLSNFANRIYTADDILDGYDTTAGGNYSDTEFNLTAGLVLATDSGSLTGNAIQLNAINEHIQLLYRTANTFALARGVYRISVIAKDSASEAGDLRIQAFSVRSDSNQARQASRSVTLTQAYQRYDILLYVGKNETTYGTYVHVFKGTANANTISISHIEVEHMGADTAEHRSVISYSSEDTYGDGDRKSSHHFLQQKLGVEVLDETDFATHASWDTANDFDDTGSNAAYTHAAGSGTLTQTSGNFANAASNDRMYRFAYTASNLTGSPVATITTAFAFEAQTLDLSVGTHIIYFSSAVSAGNFIVSATSEAGETFTLDDLSLRQVAGQTLLAEASARHDGPLSDQKGKYIISVNDGDDDMDPTDRLSIDSAGKTQIVGDLVSNTYNFAADAEANDTYVITLDPAPAAYTTGMTITFTANTANTGACTLNANSLGAKSLKMQKDQDPGSNYIKAGSVVVVVYDGTNFQMIQGAAQSVQTIDMAGATFEIGDTPPSSNVVGNYLTWSYEIGDDSVFTFELPRDWSSGTDLTIKVDWAINRAYATENAEVQWNAIWSATPHDASEALTAAGTTVDPGDQNIPATANVLTRTVLGTISGASLAAEDEMGITLTRVAIDDGNDPGAGEEPYITHLNIEYIADKSGE